MTAWSRARRAKRRRRVLVTGAVAVAAACAWPTVAARASDGWDRHVLAEARGDTPQVIAVKLGRAVAMLGDAEHLSVERIGDGCSVEPVGVHVDCAADIAYVLVPGGFTVTVERHGNTFTWDSRAVRT